MQDAAGQPMERLVQRVRVHQPPRTDFTKMLAAREAPTSDIAVLPASVSVTSTAQTHPSGTKGGDRATGGHRIQMHQRHVQRQSMGAERGIIALAAGGKLGPISGLI